MARAGSLQSSFLGGIWSPFAQGRADLPGYKTALADCLNMYPLEEGALVRRPGTALGGPTFNNTPARVFAFDITGSAPIQMEVTAGNQNGRVRFWNGTQLCYDYTSTVSSIFGSGGLMELTISSNPIDKQSNVFAFIASSLNYPNDGFQLQYPWLEVELVPLDNYTKKRLGQYLNKRTFVLQGIIGQPNTFTVLDGTYNGLSSSDPLVTLWNGSCNVQINRVATLVSPYTLSQYADVRFVMTEMQGYFLHPAVPPQRIRAIPLNTTPLNINNLVAGPGAVQFVLDQPQFIDGPFLDPPSNRDVSGLITFPLDPATQALYPNAQLAAAILPGATELPNGLDITSPSSTGVGFLPTDVGRLIRWFVQPPTYSNIAVYSSAAGAGGPGTTGNQVMFPAGSGSYFLAIGQGIFGIPISISGKNPVDFTPADAANLRNQATLAAGELANGKDATAFFNAILLNQPFWAPLPDFYCAWENYGTIVAVVDSHTVLIGNAQGSTDATQPLIAPQPEVGSELLSASGRVPLQYQLGAYSATTGYPTCGCWHEGRLWLGGGTPNLFTASVPDGVHGTIVNGVQVPSNYDPNMIFSPTDLRGDVNDGCGIAEFINSQNQNEILWMVPTMAGIIMGTNSGEWLIAATNNNNVLTPTSVQAHRMTKYGCANIEPRVTGLSTVFVQKEQRRIHEFLQDVFSAKFYGPNLTEFARNLTDSGIKELAYQEETTPILWATLNNGGLIGCTYRRIAMFSSEPPKFFGWHRHQHGQPSRVFEFISSGSSPDGLGQALTMITLGPGG